MAAKKTHRDVADDKLSSLRLSGVGGGRGVNDGGLSVG